MIVIYLCSLWLKTWPLFLDHTFTIMELSRKPHELKRGGEGGRGGRGKGEGGGGKGGRGRGKGGGGKGGGGKGGRGKGEGEGGISTRI